MVKRHNLKLMQKHQLFIKDSTGCKIFISDYGLTDNSTFAIFGPENINKYVEQKKIICFETFLLTEEYLDIKIDRNKLLEPVEKDNCVVFELVGQSNKEIIDWFIEEFPNCVFHPINEWFGEKVNTLICVLGNPHGKPVGVVKTTNERN